MLHKNKNFTFFCNNYNFHFIGENVNLYNFVEGKQQRATVKTGSALYQKKWEIILLKCHDDNMTINEVKKKKKTT